MANMNDLAFKIMKAVYDFPLRSEREIAEIIFGRKSGYQQKVNKQCRELTEEKILRRVGENPYRYQLMPAYHQIAKDYK